MDETLYQYYENKRHWWSFGSYDMDLAVKDLLNDYSATKDSKTGIVTITIEVPSPELSRDVVTLALAELDKALAEQTMTKSRQMALFLDSRIKDAKNELSAKEKEYIAFSNISRNYETSLDPAIRVQGARLDADLSLDRQVITQLVTQYENAVIQENNDTPVMSVMEHPTLPFQKSSPGRSAMSLAAFILVAALTAWRTLRAMLFGKPGGKAETEAVQEARTAE